MSLSPRFSPSTNFYASGNLKHFNAAYPSKSYVMRIASPGPAARIAERNPNLFSDLKIKPITTDSIDNKQFVP